MIQEAYSDLGIHGQLWDSIKKGLAVYPENYGHQMTRELPCLYLLVRLVKPDQVIETGVSAGVSSVYILRALKGNGKGRLYSIDLPPVSLPLGSQSGWIVPDDLRDSWDLRIEDVKQLPVPLLEETGSIDFLVHDSKHTYEHMMWKYNCIWQFMRRKGLFLSHDAGASEAFLDFMKKARISWYDYRYFTCGEDL